MRRYPRGDGGSFDLLLDTMCNMFGGMVLIAILLAVLTQATGKTKPSTTSDKDIRISAETAAMQQAEAVQLRELVARNEQRLSDMTNVVATLTANDVEQLRRHMSKLAREQTARKKKLTSRKKTAEQKKRELSRLKDETDKIQKQAERETMKVERRNLRMPRLTATDKSPVFLAVKNGVLCAINDVAQKPSPYSKRKYSPTSVKVHHEPGGLDIIEVQPEREQRLSGDALPGRIGKQILANVDRRAEFLWFAVYPDSYGEFNLAKEFFAGRGYEFNWTPLAEDETINVVPAKRIETQ